MGWKQKTCIVATMFLICGADVIVMPQEVAAAMQDEGQNFVQIGLSEVETLLKKGKYGEAEVKCRSLQEYKAGKGELDFQVLHTLGGIYRLEGKYAEEIALWKGVYEKFASIFQVNNTQELLRPLGELCSAYQAAGDFASAEPYVRRGEEILREHAGDNLEESLKDISFFRTVALFQRIGTGKIMPADASKEAAELLKDDSREIKPGIRESGWLTYYPWCELELLDVVQAAATASHTFPEEVADCRRDDDTMILLQGSDRAEKMWCLARAANTYINLLGRNKDAERILAPLYQEVKQQYRHPATRDEADGMLRVLYTQMLLSVYGGNHPEAITAGEMAWALYENTSKSQKEQDCLVSMLMGTAQSYHVMGEKEKVNTAFARMGQMAKSGSFIAHLGRMFQVFGDEKASKAEKRQALLDLRAAADKECSEDPNREPAIRRMMQLLTNIMPAESASVIRSEKDATISQETSLFNEQAYLSRWEMSNTAEEAYKRKDYQEAASLYERVLELSRAAGEDYGQIAVQALKRLASSYYLMGDKALRAGYRDDAEKLMERGYDLYEALIETHESHREDFSGLTADEQRKWFASVVDDYMEAVRRFSDCPRQSKKNHFYKRKMIDTLEKCKARILLERYAEQIADMSGILTEEETATLQACRQQAQNRREALRLIEEEQRGKPESETLQNAREEWKQAANDERQYRDYLRQQHPAYRELSKPKILTSEEAQKILPANTAYFAYALRPSKNYSYSTDMIDLFSLTKTDIQGWGYGGWTYVKDWLAYYKLLSFPDYQSFSQRYRLWKMDKQGYSDEYYLVQEKEWDKPQGAMERIDTSQGFEAVRKKLAEKWGQLFDFIFVNNLGIQHGMRIIISPEDGAPLLPFETLTCNGKTFAELYEISYAPSLSMYALMQERGERNAALPDRKDLFAMGNALYGYSSDEALTRARGGNFRELPETETELGQVGELFPEESQTILQQEEASEPVLNSHNRSGNLAQYKYLLFATHGVFEEDNPMANAIVLSQPDKRKPADSDGYVTAGEWMGYNLHSDLVYLSACETGRGSKYAGEGLIGLPYALTIAGNKSTVMTLWEIEDDAAAAFSTAFFRRLAAEQPAAQALAETKREFLHHEITEYRNPHVWGGFQLYGE